MRGILLPAFPARRKLPIVTRVGSGYFDAADLTTYTVTVDLGAAYVGKTVLVLFAGYGAANRTVSSVTLGGVAMTDVASVNSYNPSGSDQNTMLAAGMYRLAVNSAGTASLVVTFSGGMTRFICEVLTLTDLQSAVPFHTNTAKGAKSSVNYSLSATLNVPDRGVVVGWSPVTFRQGTVPSSIADTPWTGITGRDTTPRKDVTIDVFTSIAFDRLQSGATGKTMGITMPAVGPNNVCLSLASFR